MDAEWVLVHKERLIELDGRKLSLIIDQPEHRRLIQRYIEEAEYPAAGSSYWPTAPPCLNVF